ncbi:MAG: hypothetical protein JOY95_08860 [Silvibacterium sp.]|nr:hypothetical protein [Silvibacterium sp.]
MSMDQDYNEYLRKKREQATAGDEEGLSESEKERQETLSWFEGFVSKWFPKAAPAPYTVDISGNKIDPVKQFQIGEHTYYIHPVQKGRIALYGPSSSASGYESLGTVDETNFKMDYVYDAIERHSNRRETE